MRLWSIHPRYLDTRAIVAVWREGLLARAVLAGRTSGYTRHPQLTRFRQQSDPLAAIDAYLSEIAFEAQVRGYDFDTSKIVFDRAVSPLMDVSDRQLMCEWAHLNRKLAVRDPVRLVLQLGRAPTASPIFRVVPGPVADWEKEPRCGKSEFAPA